MSNDINLAVSGNLIKNGSLIVSCSPLGIYSSISDDVLNTPPSKILKISTTTDSMILDIIQETPQNEIKTRI